MHCFNYETCSPLTLNPLLRYSDLDGQHRHTVYDGDLPHPFALTVFEETVYWTDWNTRTVEKGNKYDGSGRQALVNTTHRPFDIHVCHPYRQPIGELKLQNLTSIIRLLLGDICYLF